ncbi:MAG: RNA polymerase sigma factor, partial [Spirillospora sp.]
MAILSHAGDELDDSRLVAASLDDPDAFGELFRRHAPRLHAYIRRRLGPVLADDLVSESFATAFRQRDRFDGRRDFGAWLWGIAANLIAKHHRHETRMYRAFARTGVDPAEDGVADLASDRASASG